MKTLKNLVAAAGVSVMAMFATPAEADPPVYSCYEITYGCSGTVDFLGCEYGPGQDLCVYCCDDSCYYCT